MQVKEVIEQTEDAGSAIDTEKAMLEVMEAAVNYDYERFGSVNLENGQITMIYPRGEGNIPKMEVVDYAVVSARYGLEKVIDEDREMFLQSISLPYVRAQLAEKDSFEFTHRCRTADGHLQYKKTRFSYYNRKRKSCLMTRSDVTSTIAQEEEKREQLHTALKAAEDAARAKNEFLSRMSHDLRTPMNVIMGLSSLTIDDAHNPERVCENMGKMRAVSDFMMGLVNDILSMAKIEEGSVIFHKEPYQYSEFLTNMKTMFQNQCEEKGITLCLEEPHVNAIIRVDKIRMNQIFFHIFSNAVKFTKSGGRIDYRTQNLKIEGDELCCDYVISDTGIGMSEDFQKHMYEPFMQEDNEVATELQGSGLGLSITKQLVELMGGQIHVESKQNEGTTVTISLKLELIQENVPLSAQEEQAQIKEDRENEYAALANKNILLAEDHPLNAQIASRLLEKQNMHVIHAENGRIAVEKFEASPEGWFAAVLMDIRMPEMSGLEATKAIRALDREDAQNVPIIALSANAYTEGVQKSIDAGMNAHMAKPINPKMIYDTLSLWME